MPNRIRSNRQLVKPVHTWIGIVTGVFLSILGLTGSVIVFRAEIEQATLPRSTPATDPSRRVSLDEAARNITQFRPGWHIRRVRLPAEPGDPYIFQVEGSKKRTERIVSDASSGRILGTIEPGWVDWLVDLHRNLLYGKAGRAAVGGVGILLFVLGATGLLMWLIGARKWRTWISAPRPGSTVRFHFELHRLSGLWAYCFLAVISFTGIGLAYPDAFRQAMQSMTGTPAAVGAPRGGKAQSLRALDDYLRVGSAAMPDGVPTELRLPEVGKGPVDLRLRRPGDMAPGANHVYLDAATGAVLATDRIADRPLGARFLAALAPIHYGEFGGIPVKTAWSLLALTPVLLFVTGLLAWRRPAGRKASRPASEESGSKPAVLTRP